MKIIKILLIFLVLIVTILLIFFVTTRKKNNLQIRHSTPSLSDSDVKVEISSDDFNVNKKAVVDFVERETKGKSMDSQINEIETLGKRWVINNIEDDGSFTYLYNSQGKKSNGKSNIIRQLLTFRVVARLCEKEGMQFCKIHQKNLDYIFEGGIYQEMDFDGVLGGYVMYDDVSKLGSTALLLRLLVASPQFEKYQDEIDKLIIGVQYLQRGDGSFKSPFFIKKEGITYDVDKKMKFYSGEIILALMEHYRKTKNQNSLNIAQKAENYYMREYVDRMAENYYPAYVPWHTFALSKLWHATNDRNYMKAIFKMNDKLLEIQDRDVYIGRFYNNNHPEYGKPHSASDAIYAESMVVAYKIALEVDDKIRQSNYKEAIGLVVGDLASMQICNSSNETSNNLPDVVCGGLQVRIDNNASRVDSLAHTMDFVAAIKNL